MTKGEIRKARQAARAAGQPLTGELALDRVKNDDREEFSETPHRGQDDREMFSETLRGYRARERWARAYYDSEGHEAYGGPEDR